MDCQKYHNCDKSEFQFCAICQLQRSYSLPKNVYDKKKSKKWSSFFSCNPLQAFHSLLTRTYYKLGKYIATNPSYFIILPIFFTVIGFTGFQRIQYENDIEKMYYPRGGPAPSERAIINEHFPLNSSAFLPYHLTTIIGFARILIKAEDGGTILRKHLWDEIMLLDEAVQKVSIEEKGKVLGYSDLCAQWNGECTANTVLELYPDMEEVENGTLLVNYPIMLFPLIVPMFFGGIILDEDETYIKSAEAINLNYFLRQETELDRERAMLWEAEFLKVMENTSFESLHISHLAARSIQDLAQENPELIKPYIPVTILILFLFSIGSSMMSDWVRSKVFLGLLGIVSAVMATATAFGLLMYLDVPMSGINHIIPFLMIGIGIDDMFVVLAAWRRTYLQDTNVKRLGKTYAEAGVSVTITSFTNLISFSIGCLTPIMAVRVFCVYTACSILLTFIWHLTFFGGCLALTGKLEKNQRHAFLCCVKVKAKSQSNKRPWYSFWCSGGINEDDPWNPEDNQEHIIMVFFRDCIGKMLTKNYVKGIVIALFFVYLTGAIYGCTQVVEGLDRRKLVRYDSYIVDYYNMEDELFRKYPYSIQVVLTGNITYSDKNTRTQIMALHDKFEKLPFVASKILTQSCMRNWYRYLKRKPDLRKNITSEVDFIKALRENYLTGESNPKAQDVQFNEDFSQITASRFILQTYEVNDTNADKNMMIELRKVAAESSFNVSVFNPNFILFDQYVMVRSAVLQSTFLAAFAMIIISLIFIPNPWCSLHVGFAILSIEVGVIGYMSLWDVSLDPISMVTLIMCIGFSVDFSAHVSYSYLTAKAEHPNDKIRECLFCLGLPIVQGGISTLISIVTFIFIPSYAYVAFFKVIFLVVFFAGVHGLFLIPVLLSVAGPDSLKSLKGMKTNFILNSATLSENHSVASSSEPTSTTNESTPKLSDKTNKDISSSLEFISVKIRRIDPEGCSNSGFKIEEDSNSKEESDKVASEDAPDKMDVQDKEDSRVSISDNDKVEPNAH